MHLRFCIRRQKNPCDFGCLKWLVFRTDFNPNYLIFSRFYLKNRTTIKPTLKSLFNDFNARRGIATLNSNSMVNDGNYPVWIHKRERTIGQHFHARQRLFLQRNALTLYQTYYSITYEHLFVKRFLFFKYAFIIGSTKNFNIKHKKGQYKRHFVLTFVPDFDILLLKS